MTRGVNPKDLAAAAGDRVNLFLIPPSASEAEARAMMDGAAKYGPYNWRQYPVKASVYIAAAKRHLDAWLDGEQAAPDSGAHHLGHARACLGILIDAQAHGCLADDRPGQADAAPVPVPGVPAPHEAPPGDPWQPFADARLLAPGVPAYKHPSGPLVWRGRDSIMWATSPKSRVLERASSWADACARALEAVDKKK